MKLLDEITPRLRGRGLDAPEHLFRVRCVLSHGNEDDLAPLTGPHSERLAGPETELAAQRGRDDDLASGAHPDH
jgi:hypothetical protein